MSGRTKAAVLAAVLAAVVVAAGFNTGVAQEAGQPMKMLTLVLEGNFRVKSACLFADKTPKAITEEQVKRIEFHPEYIVVIKQTGDGRVVPVHTIKEFTWEPS